MSTETTPSTARRVFLLCAFVALVLLSCWAVWRQLTVEWDTQWSYMDLFHDPEGPSGALPAELNHAQNIVHASGFGLVVLMGMGGIFYQAAVLRAVRGRAR